MILARAEAGQEPLRGIAHRRDQLGLVVRRQALLRHDDAESGRIQGQLVRLECEHWRIRDELRDACNADGRSCRWYVHERHNRHDVVTGARDGLVARWALEKIEKQGSFTQALREALLAYA